MIDTKFTPGPWVVVVVESVDGGIALADRAIGPSPLQGEAIAHVASNFPDGTGPGDQATADAHLIAAAPDLYDALRDGMNFHQSECPDPSQCSFLLNAAKVLANARGEK